MNHTLRIMRNSSLAAVAAAALAAPAGAADSDSSPIEIQSCAPIRAAAPQAAYTLGTDGASGVEITFVNRGVTAADDVTFAVGSDRGAEAIDDHGTFAPGAVIRRAYATAGHVDAQACRVVAARFVGGTAYLAQPGAGAANR